MRYTRDQDWDVPPTPFYEYVTIQGTAAEPTVLYADNNGFQIPGPLFGRGSLGAVGDFVDFGPRDHGSLFDFGFGTVAAGGSVQFTIFYGAAGTEAAALTALSAVGANVYSLGQYWADPVGGTPNTFIFAYRPPNQPPVADPNGPYVFPLNAGPFDGSGSYDPDGDPLTFTWDFGDSSTGSGVNPYHTYAEAGIYDVCLIVNDGFVDSEEVCTIAVIYDPSAGFVTGGGWIDSPYGALRLPTDLPFFNGSYYELVEYPYMAWTDANMAANAAILEGCGYPHLVTITSQDEQDALNGFFDGALQGKWYGGFQNEGETDPAAGWNWVTGEAWDYTNWAPGEPNDYYGSGSEPHLNGALDGWAWNDEENLGNVTGYVVEYENCGPTGKANFGFVSKYQKGATVPAGNTEFQFHAAGLNFHSSSYEWLVVTGSNYARFKGSGTINGEGDYKFMLWAGDGAPDTFRIKIWTEDESGTETVIYDNGFDQPIAGGSIVIHTKK